MASSPPPSLPSKGTPKKTPWSRDNKIGFIGLVLTSVLAVVSIIAGFTQPELRHFFGLDPSPSLSPAAIEITGTWRGKVQNFTDTLSLTQTGNSITGAGTSQSQTETFSETLSGSISGNAVEVNEHINENGCDASYALRVSQDGKSLSGYYTGCNNDKYMVTLTKQA